MGKAYRNKDLQQLVSAVERNYDKADAALIEKAFYFAKHAHRRQLRRSKKPFFLHPLKTALILADLGGCSNTVAAALLHDVLEDTKVTAGELRRNFGEEVSALVSGVTKLEKITAKSREERQVENLHNMLLAATRDARVIAIKLADRLHNLRTLQYLPNEDRRRIATEALAVYAPISLKLGIHQINNEMEDTAFRYLKPSLYRDLKQKVERRNKGLLSEIDAMIETLKKRLRKAQFVKKHKTVYRIYTKMQRKSKSLDGIRYDFTILKILCGSLGDCYHALGVVHEAFMPLPHKIKDYIAAPLPNLYQALHTTVIGPSGMPVKVYISTMEMDEIARKGIIAYWQLQDKAAGKLLQRRTTQLQKIVHKWKIPEEPEEFMDALKVDFLDKAVSVFTREGKRVELPTGATPIDFAYAVNPQKAFRIWKAKVDGRFVSLGRKLRVGNIVEIITSKEAQASKVWLRMVKSPEVRDALRAFLKRQRAVERKPRLDLLVKVRDRVGIFVDCSKAISSTGIKIEAASSSTMPDSTGQCVFNISLSDAAKLHKAIDKIKRIKGVKKVEIIYNE